ncbi:hypothetical protein SAMN05428988_1490 [Chitinophaga sp. YR573]|uniref:hypothetical protein n=1 Tax=Chitinophaga sp. YR573 TaxID=1881040 RepID=UPI0008B0C41D|nr:hypothetical protein [Chitinophaga sp. YR573]SEW03938.1 hypothetical protein SAMN05428988_1490 [Chitinophaga sp. YR573]
MKNAKIILTAIALFALVGGALAFKAQKFTPLPAFTKIGPVVTSTIINGVLYTTTVPLCTTTSLWFSVEGDLFAVFSTTTEILTGKTPHGITTTWEELVCTPTTTLVVPLL